jgi:soluble lytic murein transglycosylase-like protein
VSADGLNWTALAKCESGGNPRAVNPAGNYGQYQFSLSTWHAMGGAGNPIDASPAEQTARAQALYARSGAGQWGCGRHLYDH